MLKRKSPKETILSSPVTKRTELDFIARSEPKIVGKRTSPRLPVLDILQRNDLDALNGIPKIQIINFNPKYFSNLFLSKNTAKDVYFFFGINIVEILKNKSQFKEYYRNLEEVSKENLRIASLRVFRRQVNENQPNKLDQIPFVENDEVILIIDSGEARPNAFLENNSNDGQIKELSFTNNGPYRFFIVADKLASDLTCGFYQYYIDLIFEDVTQQTFEIYEERLLETIKIIEEERVEQNKDKIEKNIEDLTTKFLGFKNEKGSKIISAAKESKRNLKEIVNEIKKKINVVQPKAIVESDKVISEKYISHQKRNLGNLIEMSKFFDEVYDASFSGFGYDAINNQHRIPELDSNDLIQIYEESLLSPKIIYVANKHFYNLSRDSNKRRFFNEIAFKIMHYILFKKYEEDYNETIQNLLTNKQISLDFVAEYETAKILGSDLITNNYTSQNFSVEDVNPHIFDEQERNFYEEILKPDDLENIPVEDFGYFLFNDGFIGKLEILINFDDAHDFIWQKKNIDEILIPGKFLCRALIYDKYKEVLLPTINKFFILNVTNNIVLNRFEREERNIANQIEGVVNTQELLETERRRDTDERIENPKEIFLSQQRLRVPLSRTEQIIEIKPNIMNTQELLETQRKHSVRNRIIGTEK